MAAAILKTVTSSYLCNLLTDFDKIWHGDACWSPVLDVKLKFLTFDNLIWQVAAIYYYYTCLAALIPGLPR